MLNVGFASTTISIWYSFCIISPLRTSQVAGTVLNWFSTPTPRMLPVLSDKTCGTLVSTTSFSTGICSCFFALFVDSFGVVVVVEGFTGGFNRIAPKQKC